MPCAPRAARVKFKINQRARGPDRRGQQWPRPMGQDTTTFFQLGFLPTAYGDSTIMAGLGDIALVDTSSQDTNLKMV